jgi:hypothetical protein
MKPGSREMDSLKAEERIILLVVLLKNAMRFFAQKLGKSSPYTPILMKQTNHEDNKKSKFS